MKWYPFSAYLNSGECEHDVPFIKSCHYRIAFAWRPGDRVPLVARASRTHRMGIRWLLYLFLSFIPSIACLELPPEVRKARQERKVGQDHPIQFPHISGSFGEYRSGGRFHHGLDYKTFNRNGIPILAIEDMTVTRLYTSELGYGNGLVLSGEDGRYFTYGHMHDFLGKHPQLELLRLALFHMQPGNRASVNLPGYFSFQKGDTIGRSGESGSGAPHLHFEVGRAGYYSDPLDHPERTIQDFTAPTLLRLHTRTRAFPLKKRHTVYTEQGNTIDVYGLDPERKLPSADFRIGTYDTMAALNRNGIQGIRFYRMQNMEELNELSYSGLPVDIPEVEDEESGPSDSSDSQDRAGVERGAGHFRGKGELLHSMKLDRIATSELRTADRYYDAEKTSVGAEYVYFLYDSLSRNRPELASGVYLVEVLDGSGNIARLLFQVGQATRADLASEKPDTGEGAPIEQEEDPLLKESDVNFRHLAPYAAATFSYARQGMNLTIRIPGGAQSAKAKGRILDSEWIRAFPPVKEGLKEPSGGVRSFVFDARGLVISGYMYISGQVEKKHPDEELYLWNPSSGKWDWVGKPYRETDTRAYYNMRLKRGGIFAMLRDVSRPVIFPALAWQRPEDDLVHHSNQEPFILLREYDIYDKESWIDRDTTSVYLDGVPLPFEWAGDRSLLRVRIPEKWIRKHGSFVSIQVSDLAGNRAEPFFDLIQSR